MSYILFLHKGKEVELEAMRPQPEHLVEEPAVKLGIKGHQIDQFLTKGNLVKGLIEHVLLMVVDEGDHVDVALAVHEEGHKEEEVSYHGYLCLTAAHLTVEKDLIILHMYYLQKITYIK